jgi:K+-sensing histidine kinase KdpD
LYPSYNVFQLGTQLPAFLVMAPLRGSPARRRDFLQIVLVGSAIGFSALISMLMTFFYLRSKSKEAREVLLRLERGDLKARFQIKQFDEMGNLMLDFNRMAAEIERLVGRLEETEQARKMLFQELSHDLRTPLTSLRASVDTLALHWEEMPTSDRKAVVSVCQTEIAYFMQLLENLLFIAQMDEPRYKKTTEAVNIAEILDSELRVRQTQEMASPSRLNWELDLPAARIQAKIPGDSHLIRRLVKNVLENASRFAKRKVKVSLRERDSHFILEVEDDGPGMTAEQVESFGKVRNRRVLDSAEGSHVSLGLGSVIMKKILDLHNGSLTVRSRKAGTLSEGGLGTLIQIQLPRV